MDAEPDDEAILGALDTAPDAFAVFYRRHVDELLDRLDREAGDPGLAAAVCAEAFAAVLDGAGRVRLGVEASRLLADAARRGTVDEHATRRLGIARLERGDRTAFVDALEDELVAAARFRATHPARRIALPRRASPPRPALLAGGAGVALVALVAVLALTRDGGSAPAQHGAPSADASVVLAPMQPLTECERPARETLEPFPGIALLARARSADDALEFAPRLLPVGRFDPRAPRRTATGVVLVPSSRVAANGGCGFDDAPGLCVVAEQREFRCFTLEDVRGGRAIARTGNGAVVGVVPDGIGAVTVDGDGARVRADVRENVYQAPLGDLPGTRLRITLERF
jgi:hypothetical protein